MASPAHPFAELIDLYVEQQADGRSITRLNIDPARHFNPNAVVHGGVIFTMADTGMGAALSPMLSPDQFCATIEIKINYFAPARGGTLTCVSTVINRGKRIANIDAEIHCDDQCIARANGNFAIISRPS